ncbi:MAG: hypothetical protein A2283_23310 [Lentisphaerae bacterium RIFOXYA12_FULL_48_11]|nr:MAG: hypothetical protein A2283_23310 [Lentisphaerae bacterium RIFOXYA12_FULL_48_11]
MKSETRRKIEDFKKSLKNNGRFEELFEHLPDVCFFAKDRKMRLMMANTACLHLLGQASMDTVVGRTGHAFFPPGIANAFDQDDQRVLKEHLPILERVELMLEPNGTVTWYCTTKLPLYSHTGNVAGLMGITRPIKSADPRLNPFAGMIPVVDYIGRNLKSQLTTSEMAKVCHLSPSQFRRRFRQCFETSPVQFILKLRIQAACRLLANRAISIKEVAEQCGFSDQNYFTRKFCKIIGMTPTAHRRRQNRLID